MRSYCFHPQSSSFFHFCILLVCQNVLIDLLVDILVQLSFPLALVYAKLQYHIRERIQVFFGVGLERVRIGHTIIVDCLGKLLDLLVFSW